MGARYEHMNMEAMRKVMPEKARLMDEIFGYRINGLCKPTYNKTTQELSDTITHIHGSWEGSDYITERGSIITSCENNLPVRSYYAKKGVYCFVEDISIDILKGIKYMIGNKTYKEWEKEKNEKISLENKVKELEAKLAEQQAKLETIKSLF